MRNITQSKLTGYEIQQKNIKTLIDNHLIARYQPADGVIKEHYIVTTENLVDFIDSNFTWKKGGILKVHKINGAD